MLADRFGAKPTLVAILGYQALTLACYLIVGDLGAFYALGIGFGSLAALLALTLRPRTAAVG